MLGARLAGGPHRVDEIEGFKAVPRERMVFSIFSWDIEVIVTLLTWTSLCSVCPLVT